MAVDFGNDWFREFCTENGLNPDNELSKSTVLLARDRAVEMKKYMDAKKHYDDKELIKKLDENINRLNNDRIGHMLDAVTYAEVMGGLSGFNEFVKKRQARKAHYLRR